MSREGLTAQQYAEVAQFLECARDDLLGAAHMCRPFGRLKDQLLEMADGLSGAMGWLAKAQKRDAGVGDVKEKV